MTDEEKNILKKHVTARAVQYYRLYLGHEDTHEVVEAGSAYDAVSALAYNLLRAECSDRMSRAILDDIDEQAEKDVKKEVRRA